MASLVLTHPNTEQDVADAAKQAMTGSGIVTAVLRQDARIVDGRVVGATWAYAPNAQIIKPAVAPGVVALFEFDPSGPVSLDPLRLERDCVISHLREGTTDVVIVGVSALSVPQESHGGYDRSAPAIRHVVIVRCGDPTGEFFSGLEETSRAADAAHFSPIAVERALALSAHLAEEATAPFRTGDIRCLSHAATDCFVASTSGHGTALPQVILHHEGCQAASDAWIKIRCPLEGADVFFGAQPSERVLAGFSLGARRLPGVPPVPSDGLREMCAEVAVLPSGYSGLPHLDKTVWPGSEVSDTKEMAEPVPAARVLTLAAFLPRQPLAINQILEFSDAEEIAFSQGSTFAALLAAELVRGPVPPGSGFGIQQLGQSFADGNYWIPRETVTVFLSKTEKAEWCGP